MVNGVCSYFLGSGFQKWLNCIISPEGLVFRWGVLRTSQFTFLQRKHVIFNKQSARILTNAIIQNDVDLNQTFTVENRKSIQYVDFF